MTRDRGEKRKIDFTHALRKKKKAETKFSSPYYDNLHQYSKNKIHCSCPMCSAKTRNKGKRRNLHGNYSPNLNYRISELRRQRSMDADERDYFFT